MADIFKKAKANVNKIERNLEKIRNLANQNRDLVLLIHHFSVATYGAIRTERNIELIHFATDAANEHNVACAYILDALESLGKAQTALEKYIQIVNTNPNVKVSNTPDA